MNKGKLRDIFLSIIFLIIAFFPIYNNSLADFVDEFSITAKKEPDGSFSYRRFPNYKILLCNVKQNVDDIDFIKDAHGNSVQCDCESNYQHIDNANLSTYVPLNPDSVCSENLIYTPVINTKYKKPVMVYRYSDKYDGCYFGDNVYPAGKEYLMLFDTMDCKLATYMQYTPAHDLPGALMVMILSMLYAPIAVIFVIAGTTVFFYLVAITVNILYVFLTTTLAINLMVFISPIVFPAMLFEKYKGAFDTWVKTMISFSIQLIFSIVFSAVFIIFIDKYGVGKDVTFYNHGRLTGRLPNINCNGSSTSLTCIFKFDQNAESRPAFGAVVTRMLGIGPFVTVASSIISDFSGAVNSMITFVILVILFQKFLYQIPNLAKTLTEGALALEGRKIDTAYVLGKIKGGVEGAGKFAYYALKRGVNVSIGGIGKLKTIGSLPPPSRGTPATPGGTTTIPPPSTPSVETPPTTGQKDQLLSADGPVEKSNFASSETPPSDATAGGTPTASATPGGTPSDQVTSLSETMPEVSNFASSMSVNTPENTSGSTAVITTTGGDDPGTGEISQSQSGTTSPSTSGGTTSPGPSTAGGTTSPGPSETAPEPGGKMVEGTSGGGGAATPGGTTATKKPSPKSAKQPDPPKPRDNGGGKKKTTSKGSSSGGGGKVREFHAMVANNLYKNGRITYEQMMSMKRLKGDEAGYDVVDSKTGKKVHCSFEEAAGMAGYTMENGRATAHDIVDKYGSGIKK
ncbi:MAG: hypothetical protein LBC92_05725 [Rickettsiales bacterium]|jgi:hypothetical protein|nr:hypothetical protein [Rickettsiales bacterium]